MAQPDYGILLHIPDFDGAAHKLEHWLLKTEDLWDAADILVTTIAAATIAEDISEIEKALTITGTKLSGSAYTWFRSTAEKEPFTGFPDFKARLIKQFNSGGQATNGTDRIPGGQFKRPPSVVNGGHAPNDKTAAGQTLETSKWDEVIPLREWSGRMLKLVRQDRNECCLKTLPEWLQAKVREVDRWEEKTWSDFWYEVERIYILNTRRQARQDNSQARQPTVEPAPPRHEPPPPRREPPPPRHEPAAPRSEAGSEARSDTARSDTTRSEARSEPRSEPRSETRSEPRSEPSSSRQEPSQRSDIASPTPRLPNIHQKLPKDDGPKRSPDVHCYNCGKDGHVAKECRKTREEHYRRLPDGTEYYDPYYSSEDGYTESINSRDSNDAQSSLDGSGHRPNFGPNFATHESENTPSGGAVQRTGFFQPYIPKYEAIPEKHGESHGSKRTPGGNTSLRGGWPLTGKSKLNTPPISPDSSDHGSQKLKKRGPF